MADNISFGWNSRGGECIGTSYSVSFKCLIKATIKSQNAPVNVNVIFSDRDNI